MYWLRGLQFGSSPRKTRCLSCKRRFIAFVPLSIPIAAMGETTLGRFLQVSAVPVVGSSFRPFSKDFQSLLPDPNQHTHARCITEI